MRPVAQAEFSSDNGLTWTYTPVSVVRGVDVKVTNIRWNLAAINHGALHGRVGFAVRVDATAADNERVANQARVFFPGAVVPFLKPNRTVNQLQGLRLIKTVDRYTANPGDTINYRILYSNRLSTTVSQSIIVDHIPANTAYMVRTAFCPGVQFLDSTGAVIIPAPQPSALR